MAYGLLYICLMRNVSSACWLAGLLMLALIANGCGGRAVNKKTARDAIIGTRTGELAQGDLQVLSVTQVGPREAVVETQIHSAFRLQKVGSEWVVREVRVGRGQWEKLDNILSSLQQAKIEETSRSLEKIAGAIESYRHKNGRLPEFKDYIGLSDALYPLFLSPLIREDSWNHPLTAIRVDPATIRIVSAGPDGKLNTPDDIQIIRSNR
jgi:hypothetical protein